MAKGIRSMAKTLLMRLVRGYQRWISPWMGRHCRFYPSCSQYALDALRTQTTTRAIKSIAYRLCRCHPFGKGGVDPVLKNHVQS